MSPALARVAVRLLENHRADQRLHQRYPITLKVEYKLLKKGRVERVGSGRTMNMSSGGIFFESDDPLPLRGRVELAMEWPFLLEGVCALKLVMRGRIVRSETNGIAVQIQQHEFRTAGVRSLSHPTTT
jgi:PilZ domain